MLQVRYGEFFLRASALGPGSVVLRHEDTTLGLGWLHFANPTSIRLAHTLAEVATLVEEIQASTGIWILALAHEAAPAFEPKAKTRNAGPLAVGLEFAAQPVFYKEQFPTEAEVSIDGRDYDRTEFESAFQSVKVALAAGETYQVNLTERLRFSFTGSAWDLFASRCGCNPPPYAMFLDAGEFQLASWSPELFLERRGETLTMRPMKGTAPLGQPDLLQNEKNRAENLMIVDMVRNDLGRVADEPPRTEKIFQTEFYRTLLQMTSTVTAHSSGDA